MSKRVPQERACPFLWSSATIDAGGVHFKVLFRISLIFRDFLCIFIVLTGVVVHLTPTASAASFGHRKIALAQVFCDSHLARFFDIGIAFALRAMLCGSDIEINKFISASFALIAFGTPMCTDFN